MEKCLYDLSGRPARTADIEKPLKAVAAYTKVSLDYAREHKQLILNQGEGQGFVFVINEKRKRSEKQREL